MAIDTSEATFERDVIQRSFEQPVVVDFWAEWCGPCRTLGPIIEKAVAARDGQVSLVKVDTEANPRLAAAFQIQSIPAVKAFKDGQVVDEFIGALPPAQVDRWLDGIVPSEADALVAAGGEDDLRRALELEPGRADAAVPLARLLLARGDGEGAAAALSNVSGSFVADGLAARLELGDEPGFALLDAGDTEAGLDALVAAIAAAPDAARKDALRRVVVGVLDELGPADPLARETRRKLASALY